MNDICDTCEWYMKCDTGIDCLRFDAGWNIIECEMYEREAAPTESNMRSYITELLDNNRELQELLYNTENDEQTILKWKIIQEEKEREIERYISAERYNDFMWLRASIALGEITFPPASEIEEIKEKMGLWYAVYITEPMDRDLARQIVEAGG